MLSTWRGACRCHACCRLHFTSSPKNIHWLVVIIDYSSLNFCLPLNQQDQIIHGILRPDGSPVYLTRNDFTVIACAKEKIISVQQSTTFFWMHDGSLPSEECVNKQGCNAFRSALTKGFGSVTHGIRALDGWNELWAGGFCTACEDKAKQCLADGRLHFWNELPSMFGLPDWNTLRDEKLGLVSNIAVPLHSF